MYKNPSSCLNNKVFDGKGNFFGRFKILLFSIYNHSKLQHFESSEIDCRTSLC